MIVPAITTPARQSLLYHLLCFVDWQLTTAPPLEKVSGCVDVGYPQTPGAYPPVNTLATMIPERVLPCIR